MWAKEYDDKGVHLDANNDAHTHTHKYTENDDCVSFNAQANDKLLRNQENSEMPFTFIIFYKISISIFQQFFATHRKARKKSATHFYDP